MDKKLYYAVNGSGQGCVFTSLPIREERRKVWLGNIEGLYCKLVMQMEAEGLSLPPLKWSDEPISIIITINSKQNV